MASMDEKEKLLSELKAQEIDVSKQTKVHERQSPAADAAGAFGKYASALATERNEDPHEIMKKVPPAEHYNVEEISAKLHEQAAHALLEEHARNPHGLISGKSVAAKLEAAADRFDRLMEHWQPSESERSAHGRGHMEEAQRGREDMADQPPMPGLFSRLIEHVQAR